VVTLVIILVARRWSTIQLHSSANGCEPKYGRCVGGKYELHVELMAIDNKAPGTKTQRCTSQTQQDYNPSAGTFHTRARPIIKWPWRIPRGRQQRNGGPKRNVALPRLGLKYNLSAGTFQMRPIIKWSSNGPTPALHPRALQVCVSWNCSVYAFSSPQLHTSDSFIPMPYMEKRFIITRHNSS
jgi:hypothetical protein